MAYLNQQMKDKSFDVRLKDYNIRRKRITREEWQKHLESLPDLKDQLVTLNLKEEKPAQNS